MSNHENRRQYGFYPLGSDTVFIRNFTRTREYDLFPNMAVEFTMIMRWANLVLPKDKMKGRTGSPKWSGSPSTRLAESISNRRTGLPK